jgi:hypothetical protein
MALRLGLFADRYFRYYSLGIVLTTIFLSTTVAEL